MKVVFIGFGLYYSGVVPAFAPSRRQRLGGAVVEVPFADAKQSCVVGGELFDEIFVPQQALLCGGLVGDVFVYAAADVPDGLVCLPAFGVAADEVNVV